MKPMSQDQTNCLLCNNHTETNHHFWRCPTLLPIIQDVFTHLATVAHDLISRDADKLSLCITDSIKYSNTFRWLHTNQPPSEEALLLIRSYVSHDLFHIFKTHFNTQKRAHTALMAFLHTSMIQVKSKFGNTFLLYGTMWNYQRATV